MLIKSKSKQRGSKGLEDDSIFEDLPAFQPNVLLAAYRYPDGLDLESCVIFYFAPLFGRFEC
jgi:hypothetical protein